MILHGPSAPTSSRAITQERTRCSSVPATFDLRSTTVMVALRVSFPRSTLFWHTLDSVLATLIVGVFTLAAVQIASRAFSPNGSLDVSHSSAVSMRLSRQQSAVHRLEEDVTLAQASTPPHDTSFDRHDDASCESSTRSMSAAEIKAETLLRERWDALVRNKASSPSAAYCMWQCGENQCCSGGERTIDHFTVVSNTLKPPGRGGFDGVTLVTQGTIDRIDIFEEQVRRWIGPKVVVFAVFNHTPAATAAAAVSIAQLYSISKTWDNTLVRVAVLEHYPGVDAYSRNIEDPTMTLYPVNTLRNIAADEAPTNWVFPLDIDFVPSATLYD